MEFDPMNLTIFLDQTSVSLQQVKCMYLTAENNLLEYFFRQGKLLFWRVDSHFAITINIQFDTNKIIYLNLFIYYCFVLALL